MTRRPEREFDIRLKRWGLTPDGPPVATPTSDLLPVRWRGSRAMLKVAWCDEERRGAALMAWWDGDGAARVLARDDRAVLLERAEGDRSLADLARRDDAAANEIVRATIERLHRPRAAPAPDLVPLAAWFAPLFTIAASGPAELARAARVARCLLDDPADTAPLHGDVHHGNILDFAERGWRAIDPKALRGERAFDYANMFLNPDARIAAVRFDARLAHVAERASIERSRLLRWIIAWCGLSATFATEDRQSPDGALEMLRTAERAA